MTARDIHFATTEDGLGIAYWMIGSGPPLVHVHNLSFSHAELEWDVTGFTDYYERMAEHFTLIRIDLRGSGLSDDAADVEGYTVASLGRDIDAVLDALGHDSVALLGASNMGLVAAEYAATRPDRVNALILCDTGPVVADLPMATYMRAQRALAESGVDMLINTSAITVEVDDRNAFETLMRHALHDGATVGTAFEQWDVSQRLGDIIAPTLVIRSRDSIHSDHEQSRRLVRDIGSAQMLVVNGNWAPIYCDQEATVKAIVEFLEPATSPDPVMSGAMQTVVFTDLVASTTVLGELGDAAGREAFRRVEALVADLAVGHGGRLIKNLGDGSLLTFDSTTNALRFSLDVQQQMRANPLQVRIGLAVGEPIQEDDDVHGAVVVLASRIADLAEAGQVFASDAVRQLAIGKGFSFDGVGEVPLKGFEVPMQVWSVNAADAG